MIFSLLDSENVMLMLQKHVTVLQGSILAPETDANPTVCHFPVVCNPSILRRLDGISVLVLELVHLAPVTFSSLWLCAFGFSNDALAGFMDSWLPYLCQNLMLWNPRCDRTSFYKGLTHGGVVPEMLQGNFTVCEYMITWDELWSYDSLNHK